MKQIAIFVGDLSSEYQSKVANAIIKEAKNAGVNSNVFTNSGVYGANTFFSHGEKNIIHAPFWDDYDGVIVAGDTFGIDGMYEELAGLLEEVKCPVVCMRQKDRRFNNVLVDDYSAMCTMVEHFIVHHGFTKLCFMNGRLDLEDARRRLLAYINTMQKYGLKVTPDMVFEGDYWRNRGKDAVDWFCRNEEDLPQAIVCANDYMAVSVCAALHKKGIQIPEQICVSGYDDIEEAAYGIPPLTTMKVSAEKMGKAAFELVSKLQNPQEPKQDVYVEVTPVFRKTCCSNAEWDDEAGKRILEEKEYIKSVFFSCTSMNIAFESEDDFESLMKVAHAYIQAKMENEIFVCLCEREEGEQETISLQQRYSEKMVLRAIVTPDGPLFCEKRFDRRDVLPSQYLTEDDKVLYIHPLHGQNSCLGYVVIKETELVKMKYFVTRWVQAIGNSMERQIMYEESKELIELRKNYSKDALTGIGNRREIDKVIRQYSENMEESGGFCIVSLDMDGLKYINDTFGHLEGDVALCALAHTLKGVVGGKGVAARIGGDEYLICLKTNVTSEVEEIIEEIRHRIVYYNSNSGKEWKLDASIGYAFCHNKNGILLSMQQADKNMYDEKRMKKNARKN